MNKIYECKVNSMAKEQKRSNIRLQKMWRLELVECKQPVPQAIGNAKSPFSLNDEATKQTIPIYLPCIFPSFFYSISNH